MKFIRVARTVLEGTKKAACKNTAEERQEFRDLSAFACHRKDVEESELQIKVSLCLLQFLCNLCKHKGSIFRGPRTLFPSKSCRALTLRIIFHDFLTKSSADEKERLPFRFLSKSRT